MLNRWIVLKSVTVVGLTTLVAWLVWLWLKQQGFVNTPQDLWHIYSDRDELRRVIRSGGDAAPVIFMVLQAIQVIVAPIPGELTGSIAGFVFGSLWGAVYATLGLMAGSSIAFILGRALGQPFVNLWTTETQRAKFSFLQHRRGAWLIFIVFLIPGFPKDILTYLFSISHVGFWRFFWLSQIGRLPGTIMLTVFGAAIFDGNWLVIIITAILGMLIIAGFVYYRRAIMEWLRQSSEG